MPIKRPLEPFRFERSFALGCNLLRSVLSCLFSARALACRFLLDIFAKCNLSIAFRLLFIAASALCANQINEILKNICFFGNSSLFVKEVAD